MRRRTSGADREDIIFSPDSKEICFTAVTDKVEAISTNARFVCCVGERRCVEADYERKPRI